MGDFVGIVYCALVAYKINIIIPHNKAFLFYFESDLVIKKRKSKIHSQSYAR
jgi:hypothetical protein